MDELTGLPLAFGKKQAQPKKVDLSKLDSTRRADAGTAVKAAASTDSQDAVPPRANPAALPSNAGDGERDEDVGPQPGPSAARTAEEAALEDDEDDEEEEDDLPISHEVDMKDHVKTVSALSLDPSGARLATGSYDYDVKLWDFGGMHASNFKPFRSFESRAGHQVTDCQWSCNGAELLVANGSTQVKLFDRDGAEIGEFNKGDMYIRDLRNTDGHVGAVTSIAWHPLNPSLFLTCSSDSTLRIWNTSNRRKSTHVLIVKSKAPGKGGKTKLTSCTWSPDGKLIAATAEDGGLFVWRTGGGKDVPATAKFLRADYQNEKAHEAGSWTGGVAWSPDGKVLATRGGDGTLKLWSPKALKTPLHTATSLPSLNPETNVCFSPTGKYVLTGTAGRKAGVVGSGSGGGGGGVADEESETGVRGNGRLVVFETDGLRKVRELDMGEYSVVRVAWHGKINQILATLSSGSIRVLYSPTLSQKGALLCVTRPTRRPQIDDFTSFASDADRPIIAPHSLPMFKEDGGVSAGGRGGKRKRERERMDPNKTMKPLPPVTGPGKGGRIGAAATQHVVQGLVRNTIRDVDPREALLKYATADPNDNTWTKAWAKTQPKPVFDERPDPDEDKEEEAKRGR
ncbi:hypothetical protein JCM10207_007752 [Rhodosporidiobolus poonsookiae]